jgi:hypothetical protein
MPHREWIVPAAGVDASHRAASAARARDDFGRAATIGELMTARQDDGGADCLEPAPPHERHVLTQPLASYKIGYAWLV